MKSSETILNKFLRLFILDVCVGCEGSSILSIVPRPSPRISTIIKTAPDFFSPCYCLKKFQKGFSKITIAFSRYCSVEAKKSGPRSGCCVGTRGQQIALLSSNTTRKSQFSFKDFYSKSKVFHRQVRTQRLLQEYLK